MQIGVEYRTTERYNGQVVYKKCVAFGALPNNSSKSVAFSSTDRIVTALRLNLSDGATLNAGVGYDHMYSTTKQILVGNTKTNIRVVTSDDMSNLTAIAFVEYVMLSGASA